MNQTDDVLIGGIAKSCDWQLFTESWWYDDQVIENRVDSEPERAELTQVWRRDDVLLTIHYDHRYLTSGGYGSLQPVFWKSWEGEAVNGGERGYMSSRYMARAFEVYPHPSEGLSINRRWLMGSIIDQLNA